MTKILRLTSAPVTVLLVLLTVITMVSGVVTLFYHTFPAIPTTATMTTTCNYYPNGVSLVSDPSSVVEGSNGQITFVCSSTEPAFTISGGVFTATPYLWFGSFTSPYTTLWIYQWDGGTTTGACSGRTGARQIEFSVTEVDMAAQSYSYCAEYLNVGSSGLPSFALYWVPAGPLPNLYHSLPLVPTTTTMTTTCSTLIVTPTSVVQGSSGQINAQCSDTSPAFTISGGTFSATPNFDGTGFTAPYTSLWIYQWDGGTTTGACSGRTGARELKSGVTQANMAPFGYNYCAEYASVGGSGLPSFYVRWDGT